MRDEILIRIIRIENYIHELEYNFKNAFRMPQENKEHEYVKGEAVLKVPALMTIDRCKPSLSIGEIIVSFYSAAIEFHCVIANKRAARSSSLFSFEWLATLFGLSVDDELLEAKAKGLNGDVTARLKLRTISVSY